MILRLAIEQARSQRRYTAWTVALLTLALGMVTFSLSSFSMQRELGETLSQVGIPARDHFAQWQVGLGDPADIVVYGSDGETVLLPTADLDAADLDARITSAITSGSEITVSRWTWVYLRSQESFPQDEVVSGLYAYGGTFPWNLVIAVGSPPGSGELVLSAGIAQHLGVGIGDRLVVRGEAYGLAGHDTDPERTLTISGLAYTCSDDSGWVVSTVGGFGVYCPSAYASWEDSNDPTGLFASWMYQAGSDDDSSFPGADTMASWSGDPVALRTLPEFDQGAGMSAAGAYSGSSQGADIGAAFAALVIVGMVVMAFAVGRAQAQVRLQWVGTARTLGATRRAIAASTLVESALVALVATAVGLGLGLAGAALHLAYARGTVPYPFLPETISVPTWLPVSVAGGGLALALIIGAVPAFWAARVPPVAALKPVNDLSQAEVSRRIKTRWLLVPFVASLVLGALPRDWGWQGALFVIAVIVGGVLGWVLLLEWVRHSVPAIGTWMSRRRPAWCVAAGDALVTRPRQAVPAAFMHVLALGAFSATVLTATFWSYQSYVETLYDAAHNPTDTVQTQFMPSGVAALGFSAVAWGVMVFAVLQVIALAISFAGERTFTSESATRRALGLSGRGEGWAKLAQHAVPQIAGLAIGTVTGLALAIYLQLIDYREIAYAGPTTTGEFVYAIGYAAWPVVVAMAVGVAVVLVGAGIVALASRSRTPVEAMRGHRIHSRKRKSTAIR